MRAKENASYPVDSTLLATLDEPEREQVTRLMARLGSGAPTPESVGSVLPQAVIFRARLDSQLPHSIVETTEKAIQLSVERDANVLSESLFLVIGPAIRKALARFIHELVSSLNNAFDHTVSPRSIRWRIEAVRSRRSFTEIALEQTMLYRVEQAFLVHRLSGLLLCQASAKGSVVSDPDLVSSMLQAVQDFMKDSLKLRREETVESISVGRFTILMEAGPSAVIALVVQGTPPPTLRLRVREALETTHLELRDKLERFRGGDIGQFAPAEPILRACLQGELKQGEKRFPVFAAALGLAVIAVFGLLAGWGIQGRIIEHRLLDRLSAEPGIVVIDSSHSLRHVAVTALRDGRAADPAAIAAGLGIRPGMVDFHLRPYVSDEPGLLAASRPEPARGSITVAEEQDLVRLAGEIEALNVLYLPNSATRAAGQETTLDEAASLVRQIAGIAEWGGIGLTLTVTGHSAGDAADADSFSVSHARAMDAVRGLTDRGVSGVTIVADSVGIRIPDHPWQARGSASAERRVTFSIERQALPTTLLTAK